jgi:hypothetical protein
MMRFGGNHGYAFSKNNKRNDVWHKASTIQIICRKKTMKEILPQETHHPMIFCWQPGKPLLLNQKNSVASKTHPNSQGVSGLPGCHCTGHPRRISW